MEIIFIFTLYVFLIIGTTVGFHHYKPLKTETKTKNAVIGFTSGFVISIIQILKMKF